MVKKNVTWKLDEKLVNKLKKLAEADNRSLTKYVELLFINHVKNHTLNVIKKTYE